MAWLSGYPREKIEWHPTIDKSKCIKCGMCMNCGKGVYEWTDNGPEVAHPLNCVVGCSTCANLCAGKAISFPDVETLRRIYKEESIWAAVRKEMERKGVVW